MRGHKRSTSLLCSREDEEKKRVTGRITEGTAKKGGSRGCDPDSSMSRSTGSRKKSLRRRLTQTTVSPLILALFISLSVPLFFFFRRIVTLLLFIDADFRLTGTANRHDNVLVGHRPPWEVNKNHDGTVVVAFALCAPAQKQG